MIQSFAVTKVRGKLRVLALEQYRALERSIGEGESWVLTLEPENERKTRQQEKGFHAMVTPWAKERGWEIDDLKRFLLGRIFGHRDDVSPLTGERLLVEPRTSQLSKTQYSDLIEQTLRIAAEDGFVLIAPNEWADSRGKVA